MKNRVDLIIKGNLIAESIGGGQIYAVPDNDYLNKFFDTEDAIIIDGSVEVTKFNADKLVVAVIGQVALRGGNYGKF